MKLATTKVVNALSIDVEDWFQGMFHIRYKDWHLYENRLDDNLTDILGLLKKYNVRATFFILGYIAERFPGLIEIIMRNGHELASHGYYHRPVFEQTRREFESDILRSKKAIESITNGKIIGYRAPFFSIVKNTLWALDILKGLGFEYDSSVFPTKNFLYGIPDAPHQIYRVNDNGLIEFPLSVIGKKGVTIPICGGFYMRVLPYSLLKWGLSYFNHSDGPAVIYLHPWELDVNKPKIRMPLKWKIIHNYNIQTMKKKLETLINDFRFTTISEVLFGA